MNDREHCLVCKEKLAGLYRNGKNAAKCFQHHLWSHHGVEVMRSHELAAKWNVGKLTEEDYDEIRQRKLSLASRIDRE